MIDHEEAERRALGTARGCVIFLLAFLLAWLIVAALVVFALRH